MDQSVFMTCPALSRHGGIRVILEWANYLAQKRKVYLWVQNNETACTWKLLHPNVELVSSEQVVGYSRHRVNIFTSPHSAKFLGSDAVLRPGRSFIFLQMLEHMFHPKSKRWERHCRAFYTSPYPLITISRWGIEELKKMGRTGPIHYVGNGVNLSEFPISIAPKDGRTVLIEGFVPGNPTKDTDFLAGHVARALRNQGYRILAFGALPLPTFWASVPHEYYLKPDLHVMNRIYERATILIKASKYDFRSCSPMEAMTKGTVTARAIIQGDDDLIHETNCLRCGYSTDQLFAISQKLLTDEVLRTRLAAGCYAHVGHFNWDYWMQKIEEILWNA